MPLQQGHPPAARGQAGGTGAAGQSGADHQRLAHRRHERRACVPGLGGLRLGAGEASAHHFPFLAGTRHALHDEAGGDQPSAHEAGAGEGAQRRPGGGQPRQFGVQRVVPHLRILRRVEAVEEPGVDPGVEVRQALQGIADQQGQGHPAAVQLQALEARVDGPVLGQQWRGIAGQMRPQGQGALQVGMGQRVFLDADEMQPGARRRAALEQLPGAEEVHPGAEAGLADDQAVAVRQRCETLGQVVAAEEHVAGLLQAVGGGEVHVVEQP
ncbi:hypothetical protein D9M70_403170 [compost metagenome]